MRCINCNQTLTYIIHDNKRSIYCPDCKKEFDYVDFKLVEIKGKNEQELPSTDRVFSPSKEREQAVKPRHQSGMRAGKEKATDSVLKQNNKSSSDKS